MNTISRHLALAVLFVGMESAALADTATTTGTTTIIRPVTITQSSPLSFGSVVKPTTGTGTVTLTSASDTVDLVGTGALVVGSASRAKYAISGEGGQLVSISMPPTFDMTDGGSDTLTVTLASDLGTSTTLSDALGAVGTATLNVGGNFSITSATVTGAYSGTFDVGVAYQ